jgi:predicted transcriptional regulator
MEKIARATLRHLFNEYLKAPAVLYTINHIIAPYKADPIEVSSYLAEKHWIRERWIYQNNLVACRITVAGIEEVNPAFIYTKLKRLMVGLLSAGGRRGLMEVFDNNLQEYVIALDIVFELQKLGLIEIIHHGGNIEIELTESGYKFAERKGRSLFVLVAA